MKDTLPFRVKLSVLLEDFADDRDCRVDRIRDHKDKGVWTVFDNALGQTTDNPSVDLSIMPRTIGNDGDDDQVSGQKESNWWVDNEGNEIFGLVHWCITHPLGYAEIKECAMNTDKNSFHAGKRRTHASPLATTSLIVFLIVSFAHCHS